jgi:hypothetical protein
VPLATSVVTETTAGFTLAITGGKIGKKAPDWLSTVGEVRFGLAVPVELPDWGGGNISCVVQPPTLEKIKTTATRRRTMYLNLAIIVGLILIPLASLGKFSYIGDLFIARW